MSTRRIATIIGVLVLIFLIVNSAMGNPDKKETLKNSVTDLPPKHLEAIDPDKENWKAKDESFWRSVLSEQQFAVCRGAGTERAFSGQYCAFKKPGIYSCYCCGQELFDGDSKFESGTGWPSFFEALKPGLIEYISDTSHGMVRTEVRCTRCGAHLGHVFDDGPPPSGKRYCINSICLLHKPK